VESEEAVCFYTKATSTFLIEIRDLPVKIWPIVELDRAEPILRSMYTFGVRDYASCAEPQPSTRSSVIIFRMRRTTLDRAAYDSR
jgi:hypothetical protein